MFSHHLQANIDGDIQIIFTNLLTLWKITSQQITKNEAIVCFTSD